MLLTIVIGLAASLALAVAQLGTILPLYQDRFTALLNDLRVALASLGVGPDVLQWVSAAYALVLVELCGVHSLVAVR